MAISLDATIGSKDANTYILKGDADDIVDGFVEDDDVLAWSTSTDDQKNRALYTAAQRLDREEYLGVRTNGDQAMQWPRIGVRKPDVYVNRYRTGFPYRYQDEMFDKDEIPDQIKKAQTVLAVYLNNNKDGIGLSGLEDYKNVQIGPINVTPDKYGAVGADRIPPMVQQYLTGLRISTPGTLSIRRS